MEANKTFHLGLSCMDGTTRNSLSLVRSPQETMAMVLLGWCMTPSWTSILNTPMKMAVDGLILSQVRLISLVKETSSLRDAGASQLHLRFLSLDLQNSIQMSGPSPRRVQMRASSLSYWWKLGPKLRFVRLCYLCLWRQWSHCCWCQQCRCKSWQTQFQYLWFSHQRQRVGRSHFQHGIWLLCPDWWRSKSRIHRSI